MLCSVQNDNSYMRIDYNPRNKRADANPHSSVAGPLLIFHLIEHRE